MTRREASWLIARATATIAGQSFFPDWLAAGHDMRSGAPPEPDRWTNYKPQFFSAQELASLDAFTAILIPTDETPGAREAHVAAFIDFVVHAAAEYAPETQAQWRKAMRWLDQHKFGGATSVEQTSMVTAMSKRGADGFSQFQLIKQMTVYAFYTSRVGLIDNLEYKGLAYLTEFPGCTHPEHQRM
jgi:glucoside 3-dehydrogenase (cytochrome c) hitch-hiker subunit